MTGHWQFIPEMVRVDLLYPGLTETDMSIANVLAQVEGITNKVSDILFIGG